MSRSLLVPGMLHILSNAVQDLRDVMPGWGDWVAGLKHVCTLLRKPWSKDRLLQTCFAQPPASLHRGLYQHFSGQVYEARWGTVTDAVEQLLPLEPSLRFFWSADAFLFRDFGS
eukprot:4640180-Alexandrium_andersonii.AAC.1